MYYWALDFQLQRHLKQDRKWPVYEYGFLVIGGHLPQLVPYNDSNFSAFGLQI